MSMLMKHFFPGFKVPLDDVNFEKTPYDAFAAYCRSKAANIMFSKGLSRKLKVLYTQSKFEMVKSTYHTSFVSHCWGKAPFPTGASVVDIPNYISFKHQVTYFSFQEQNIEGVTTYSLHPGVIRTEISRHFDTTVWFGASWAFNNIMGWFLKSPKCGAQTTIYCAVDEACAGQTGMYYR